jgi:hypothetical protein
VMVFLVFCEGAAESKENEGRTAEAYRRQPALLF